MFSGGQYFQEGFDLRKIEKNFKMTWNQRYDNKENVCDSINDSKISNKGHKKKIIWKPMVRLLFLGKLSNQLQEMQIMQQEHQE